MMNDGRTTKLISVKACGSNINLHPLITIKLINAGKAVLKKCYGFDEVLKFLMKSSPAPNNRGGGGRVQQIT